MLIVRRQFLPAPDLYTDPPPLNPSPTISPNAGLALSGTSQPPDPHTLNARVRGLTDCRTPPLSLNAGSALSRYGRDLTAEARQGLLDPCVGREEVLDRCLQVGGVLTGTLSERGCCQALMDPCVGPEGRCWTGVCRYVEWEE